MSGSGNHDGDHPRRQPSNTLGGKIQQEISSALRLLFKSASQHGVDLTINPPLVSYITELSCQSVPVLLETPDVQVSEDPVSWQKAHPPVWKMLPLIETVPLAEEKPCALEPALCKAPVIESTDAALHRVAFENMRFTQAHSTPLEAFTTTAQQKSWERLPKPVIKPIPIQPLNARSLSLAQQLPKAQVRENPKLFALPIRKMPIPPFRFSAEARERFRQALAEKAGTHASNVQLKVIFERMNMAFYTTIQQDEQGYLRCVPKNELIGRNLSNKSGQLLLERLHRNTENTYLIVGFRLDNKQDVRAMVPLSSLK